jgi:hypothetical protein
MILRDDQAGAAQQWCWPGLPGIYALCASRAGDRVEWLGCATNLKDNLSGTQVATIPLDKDPRCRV